MPRADLAWEPLSLLLDDGLAEIVTAHHVEIGVHKDVMPLDVDWSRYFEAEKTGALKVIAAREDDRLVGYASFFVMPHLHYATTQHALNDGIYLEPRSRTLAVRLIKRVEADLAAMHTPRPVRIIYHAKLVNQFGDLLERLGYKAFETLHDRIVRA